jgi:hypothetical protein
VDIPMSTRTFVSWHEGSICKFTRLGLITSEIILQLRDKDDCGGPAGTGQTLRPAVPNIERVGGVLRLVIPDNVIPTILDSVGFLVGEPVAITGLTGAYRDLNGTYVISAASPGEGLAGAAVGSYLVEVPSPGADIASTTLAGVNLCLTEGRVTSQFNSNGDVGGLGSNVFGYIGGQLFPNAGGGGGGAVSVFDEGVLVDAAVTSFDFIGAGVTASSAGPGAVDITVPGGGGGAPVNAEYLVLSADATLTDERVFTAGTGLSAVDGGAGGNYTLSVSLTLAQLLANGNTTGGNDIVVSSGDTIVGQTDLVLSPGAGVADNVIIDGLTWPSSDGTSGQALVTNGAGVLSFANPTPGLAIQDEGVTFETAPTTINFTGAGVTASSGGAGIVNVSIPGGGGGTVTLQQAYENGNTIVTDATNGPLDVSGTQSISLDSTSASNFTTTGASLTLSTITSGDVLVSSADSVLVDGTDGVEINSSAGPLNIGNDADAQPINVGTGAAARSITIGNTTGATGVTVDTGTSAFALNSTVGETLPVATLTSTGANGDSIDLFVGDGNPNGVVTGQAGSLFFRDTGAGAELYLNTSTGSGTMWTLVSTGGGAGVTLQQAYDNGNTIVTSATSGDLDVSGTEAISLDASQASNFSVAGASLTLETTTSGDVLVDSAGSVTVRGDTGVVVTGDTVADASAVGVLIEGATSSGAGNDGGDVVVSSGTPGVGGAVGDVFLRQPSAGTDGDPIVLLERTGDESVGLFVGGSDPSGSVTADAGSLFLRDTGTTGELYLNTSTGTGTTWDRVVTSGTDAGAVLQWGNDSVGNSTAARVLDPGFEGRLAPLLAGTAFADLRAPRAGTLRNLYVQHNNPGGTGAVITYTVYVNGVATALSAGVASTAAGGADTANSVSVAAGDRIRIVVTKAAVAGGGGIVPEATLEVAA